MLLTGIEVVDPDGWDRTVGKFAASWATPITLHDFIKRGSVSTCRKWLDYPAAARKAISNFSIWI